MSKKYRVEGFFAISVVSEVEADSISEARLIALNHPRVEQWQAENTELTVNTWDVTEIKERTE